MKQPSDYLRLYLGLGAIVAACYIPTSQQVEASPPLTRALQVACTKCHTVWPRLNAYGRRYKAMGLADKVKDAGTPFGAALTADVNTQSVHNANNNTNSSSGEIAFPDLAAGVYAGSFAPQFGGKVVALVARTPNGNGGVDFVTTIDQAMLSYNFIKGQPVCIEAFKQSVFGFDPYLGLLALDIGDLPLVQESGTLLAADNTSGGGLAIQAYMGKKHHWYGALAVETGRNTIDATAGTSTAFGGGALGIARVAYEGSAPNHGSWNVGAAFLDGSENINQQLGTGAIIPFSSNVNRLIFDGAYQVPVNHKKDLWETIAVVSNGTDNNVQRVNPFDVETLLNPDNAPQSGAYLQTWYYFKGVFGPTAVYDHTLIDNLTTDHVAVGADWLANPATTKFGIRFGHEHDSLGQSSNSVNLLMQQWW